MRVLGTRSIKPIRYIVTDTRHQRHALKNNTHCLIKALLNGDVTFHLFCEYQCKLFCYNVLKKFTVVPIAARHELNLLPLRHPRLILLMGDILTMPALTLVISTASVLRW